MMDKRAIRTPEGAKQIIEHNVSILYHLPQRYKYLTIALRDVRMDLLKLMKFCKDNTPIIWHQKYVWFIDAKRFARVRDRGRGSEATSNRRFNFLCCIGAINKLEQTENNMTGVNITFLLNECDKGKIRPINTFTVYRYTPAKLEEMEKIAEELVKRKITAKNISNDKLVASGLFDIAKGVYFANNPASIRNKEVDLKLLMSLQDELIAKKGFTTKAELCEGLGWNRSKIDNLLRVFREQWGTVYKYSAPTNIEIEQYQLKDKSWIIRYKP